MKNLLLLLLTITTVSFKVDAQTASIKKVELCADYDRVTGVPTGVGKYWDIANDGKGSNVYLIYTQDKIIREDLTLYIDKKNASGSYIAYSTHYFENDISSNAKKWAMYDINFKEEGDYRITVIGKNELSLAVTYADIKYMKVDANKANQQKLVKNEAPDTYYYENSSVYFGERIKDGVLSGSDTVFKLYGSSKEIFAKVEQTDDLKLTKVYVDIYTGEDFKEKVSSIDYDIDDITWNWISVPIKFYKKGKYVVDFYTQDDVFINSGYFTVK